MGMRSQKRTAQTQVVSDHQSIFGHGEIRKDFYGHIQSDVFSKGVRVLENFDISEQQTLQKRVGGQESKKFEVGLEVEVRRGRFSWKEKILNFKYVVFEEIVIFAIYVETKVEGVSYYNVFVSHIQRDEYEAFEGNVLELSQSGVNPFQHMETFFQFGYGERTRDLTILRGVTIKKLTERYFMVLAQDLELPIVLEKTRDRIWRFRFLGTEGIYEWGLEEIYEKKGIILLNAKGVYRHVTHRLDSTQVASLTTVSPLTAQQQVYGFQFWPDGELNEHSYFVSSVYNHATEAYDGFTPRVNYIYPLDRGLVLDKSRLQLRDTPLDETLETVITERNLTQGGSRLGFFSVFQSSLPYEVGIGFADFFGANGSTPLYMFALIKEEILERFRVGNVGGGFGLVRMVKIDLALTSGGSDISDAEGRDFLVRVYRANGEERYVNYDGQRPYNAIVQFYLSDDIDKYYPQFGSRKKSRTLMVDGRSQVVADERLGFSSFVQAIATLGSANVSISAFSVPMCSVAQGVPSLVETVEGRTVLTGFKDTNRLVMSSSIAPLGFSQRLPSQMDFVSRIVGRITEADTTDKRNVAVSDLKSFLPGGDDSSNADYVFYYGLQTQPAAGPIIRDVALDTNSGIKWVATVQELLVGTTKSEYWVRAAQGGALTVSNMNMRGWQSGRGTNSSLVAKGDYAVFFIGPRGNDLYAMAYTEQKEGMESAPATVYSGDLGQIVDMQWDKKRRALWVVHGEGEVSLHYKNRDVDVGGWGHYKFDPGLGWKALSLIVTENFELGFTTIGGKAVIFPSESQEFVDIDKNDERYLLQSRVSFFRNPLQGASGAPFVYRKKVGRTKVMVLGGTVFEGGKDEKQIIVNDEMRKDGLVELPMETFVEGLYIPWLTLGHSYNEAIQVLSVASRYELTQE